MFIVSYCSLGGSQAQSPLPSSETVQPVLPDTKDVTEAPTSTSKEPETSRHSASLLEQPFTKVSCDLLVSRAYPKNAVLSAHMFTAALPHRTQQATTIYKPLSETECPTEASLLHLDPRLDNDTNIDQRASHIEFKYQYYVTRCNRTNGIMWKHMTIPVMQAVTERVVVLMCELLRWECEGWRRRLNSLSGEGDAESTSLRRLTRPRRIRVLDWASGCGAGTEILRDTLLAQFTAGRHHHRSSRGEEVHDPPSVDILGIDLMKPAVAFAQQHLRSPTAHNHQGAISYCHADGTKLSWIQDGEFDLITSFGGLLHLPSAVMCSTVQQLLRKLRPGGVMWGGYLDTYAIADALAKCSGAASTEHTPTEACSVVVVDGNNVPSPVADAASHGSQASSSAASVHTTILKENDWFKNTGMPRVYRRKKPYSVVWYRRHNP